VEFDNDSDAGDVPGGTAVAGADSDDGVAVADTAVECTRLWKSNSCACFSFLFGCMLLTCSEIINRNKEHEITLYNNRPNFRPAH